jgi:hypothetical protein
MIKYTIKPQSIQTLWMIQVLALSIMGFYCCKSDSSKVIDAGSTAQVVTASDNLTASVQQPTTFLNVTKIAKQPKDVVDAYLGAPNFHETISPSNAPCPCEKYSYKESNIEIVFMNNKADWITVYKMNEIKYDSASILKALGLKYTTPFLRDDYVIKWNDFDGFDQLSAFGDGKGQLSYIFLKAITH